MSFPFYLLLAIQKNLLLLNKAYFLRKRVHKKETNYV
jgi:hypothetical protein